MFRMRFIARACIAFIAMGAIMPLPIHADDLAGCPAGTVRKATAEDVANFQKLNGSTVSIGTCLDQVTLNQIGLNNNTLQAQQDLANFVCSNYKVGYDSSVSPAYLKEHNVYFSAPTQGMNPKFLVCADKFLNAAKAQGLNPCITAALRTVAAQRASCLDQANRTVCGRSSNCTSFSMCPHVNGIALDIKSQSGKQGELQRLASAMNLVFTLPTTDAVHMQPQSACKGAGSQTTPTQTPSQAPSPTTPGSRQPASPDISDPSTEIPAPSTSCPAGYTPTAFQNNDTGASYIGCSPLNNQSYCQVGYVFFNNQCAPTQCNGSSQYAVTNLNPIQVISCNQQQTGQCPQGYIMVNNQCTPFNQNQPGTQGQTPQTGGTQSGTQSSLGSTPATGQSTTGLGTSGQNTTSTSASQCTPQYACQNGVVYFQTSFCTVQTYQTCQYGCGNDGMTCALTSTSTASTSTTRSSVSFIDQLNNLLHPSSPTSSTPSGGTIVGIILDSMSSGQTAVSLNQDIRNATGQTAGTTVGSSAFPSIGSIYGGPTPLIVTQTFTASDQPVPTGTSSSYSSQQPTFFQNALLDLKTTLLSVLTYLHLIQQRP